MTYCKHGQVYWQQSGIFYKGGANYNIGQIPTKVEHITQAKNSTVTAARHWKENWQKIADNVNA